MRPRKYRVWDKARQQMIYAFELTQFDNELIQLRDSGGNGSTADFVLMDWVGYNDTNGVPIYEFDWVNRLGQTGLVEYRKTHWVMVSHDGPFEHEIYLGDCSDLTIVGNIFETISAPKVSA